MKNLLRTFLAFLLVFSVNSCGNDEKVIDDVLNGVTNGAVLRTIQVISGEYAIGSVDPTFTVEIEEQDVEDGALLQSVDYYVTFIDDSAGTTSNEVQLGTIDASEFSTDTPFGLPRYTLSVTLAEALAALGLVEADTFGGDVFQVRLSLNLTDGRVFSVAETGGVVTGGFFSSPFLYNVNVVCSIPEDYMIGDYEFVKTSSGTDPFFPTFGEAISPTPQTVTISGTGATREFIFQYYPTSFNIPYRMTFTLSCGNILLFGENSVGTLSCNGGANSIEQCTGAVPSTYSLADDTQYDIDLIDFCDDGGCGTGGYDVSIRLTKL